ncbi:cytochrome c oxidase assembly factor 1 homolog isoform X2 [Suricata suricatta]|nr:cytochrome c oxidase assembly factor 1 homolog isoform X2 [Suricata suricatta]XP_029782386.1 cytochrome c oxidase assembly factor 1 homolog isoform X2 [Suricata suricatta]XP_029782402.1 cytochrome c oxidase assembly factor 1 homolog isoform X2 [Suricata suricatta]XP_029782408.1 cytochrome c oxidase assembly factor 1 homolog isoform X2 [Suricata suricatta]
MSHAGQGNYNLLESSVSDSCSRPRPPELSFKLSKFPGSKMPLPLGKLVFLSSVVASGSCTLIYYLTQKAFSKASYYQLALEQLHRRPEALEALGPPLRVHDLRLTDQCNFVDIADAQLKIPVSGSKSEGHLYVSSSRGAPFQRWHLQEVFLELKDGQQIPVFKPSGDTDGEGGKQ